MHVEEGRLQALLHDELADADSDMLRRHIAECALCRGQLEDLERQEEWLMGALRTLDHPVPQAAVGDVISRGTQRDRPSLRWAAGIALVVAAAGTAYAIPGSPVRRWIDRLVARPAGEQRVGGGGGGGGGGAAGVSLEPGPRFSIVFTGLQPRGIVTITLTDGSTIRARRIGRGGTATFTAEIERLVIQSGGDATDFEIDIPRGAAWVEVLVAGRRVFLKDGLQVVTAAPADARGRYILSLSER